MVAQRQGARTWLDSFHFESECLSSSKIDSETPVFVDIGGGIGRECQRLKEKHPEVQGRIILQDTPPVIEQALPIPGLVKMPYDFWTPQPVKRMSSICIGVTNFF